MKDKKIWIIIASITGFVLLVLGSLYMVLDFLEEREQRQHLQQNQEHQNTNQAPEAPQNQTAPDNQDDNSADENTNPPQPEQNAPDDGQLSITQAREFAENYLSKHHIDATFLRDDGMDREAGLLVWELEYRTADGLNIEFYINASNGDIVKFEMRGRGSRQDNQGGERISLARAREFAERYLASREINASFLRDDGMDNGRFNGMGT